MKNRSLVLTVALSTGLTLLITFSALFAIFGLSVHPAYASSCFTDTGGHWAEAFICWMRTTGLSSGYLDGTFRPNNDITRAEVASLLYKEASGDTYVSMGASAWQPNGGSLVDGAYIQYFTDSAELKTEGTIIGDTDYQATIPLITTLHNQQMTAKGAELCYNATETLGGSITGVAVQINDGAAGLSGSYGDPTTRTDQTCRIYSLPSPVKLVGTDTLTILVTAHLDSVGDFVDVYSATAIQGFSPTAGQLAPSPSFPGLIPGAKP